MTRAILRMLGEWAFISVAMVIVFGMTGRLVPHHVPDTQSYLSYPFHSLDEALRSTRTIGYPLLLKGVGSTVGLQWTPLVHLLIHATASWMMLFELKRWGTPAICRWAAALAVAFGCTSLDNINTIATDAPAASIGVMAGLQLMAWARTGRRLSVTVTFVLLCIATITLRPAYLAMIPWTVIAGPLLIYRWGRTDHRVSVVSSIRQSILLSSWIVLPVIGWIIIRGVVVNDYAFLPFGHQNLAGITVQLVSEQELLALEGSPGVLAKEIVESRERFERAGNRLAPGDAHAALTIESRWDDYVWHIVFPAADGLYPGDIIASNRAAKELNQAIIRQYPVRYLRWLGLGMRRAIWGTAANIAMHPLFLVCISLWVAIEIARIVLGWRVFAPIEDEGLSALFVVAITYFFVHAGFIVLTSPPIGRFADAAAIMIPAWAAAKLTGNLLRLSRP
jgi:hypothetical protein